MLDRVAHDAEMWGGQGRAAVHQIHRSLRNLSIKLDKGLVSGFLSKVTKTAEKLAPQAIKAALVSQFGPAAAIALEGVDLAVDDTEAKPESKAREGR